MVKSDDLLPPVSRNLIEEVLVEIEGYLNTFNQYFTNTILMHEGLTIHKGADVLFAKLLRAQAYAVLEKDGLIQHGYWRKQKGVSQIL